MNPAFDNWASNSGIPNNETRYFFLRDWLLWVRMGMFGSQDMTNCRPANVPPIGDQKLNRENQLRAQLLAEGTVSYFRWGLNLIDEILPFARDRVAAPFALLADQDLPVTRNFLEEFWKSNYFYYIEDEGSSDVVCQVLDQLGNKLVKEIKDYKVLLKAPINQIDPSAPVASTLQLPRIAALSEKKRVAVYHWLDYAIPILSNQWADMRTINDISGMDINALFDAKTLPSWMLSWVSRVGNKRACQRCVQMKVRCDFYDPCKRCEKAGKPCIRPDLTQIVIHRPKRYKKHTTFNDRTKRGQKIPLGLLNRRFGDMNIKHTND